MYMWPLLCTILSASELRCKNIWPSAFVLYDGMRMRMRDFSSAHAPSLSTTPRSDLSKSIVV